MRRIAVVAVVLGALTVAAAHAAAPVQPYGTDDPGRFFQIIPPGEAGNAPALQAAQFLTSGKRPAHFEDQRDMYTNLLYATPGLTDGDIGKYFKDATFGVPDGQAERTYSPRDDV